MIEPSDQERAELPETTRRYLEDLESRLQFDPGGSDKIDELESALGHVRHTASCYREDRDKMAKDLARMADKLSNLGVCPRCLEEVSHDVTEPFAHLKERK